ncbi:MAG: CpsB/CapC family capsule biosynthesis tyrosine phosphatase [Planctomycetota bacterium]
MIDIHAHVLPAIDDGPADMDEALELVRAAADDGVTTIVATPHMLDGVYNATRPAIFARLGALKAALDEHGIPMTVLGGADVHAEADLPDRLRAGELVTVADRGKHLMIELPADVMPSDLHRLFFAIQLQGVKPIISHPERNKAIQDDPGEVVPLVEAGCLTQVTAASILGRFGSQAETCAMTLFDCDLVHLVATDMHGVRSRRPRLAAARDRMIGVIGRQETDRIIEQNAAAVVHGRHLQVPDPIPVKPQKKWFFW